MELETQLGGILKSKVSVEICFFSTLNAFLTNGGAG